MERLTPNNFRRQSATRETKKEQPCHNLPDCSRIGGFVGLTLIEPDRFHLLPFVIILLGTLIGYSVVWGFINRKKKAGTQVGSQLEWSRALEMNKNFSNNKEEKTHEKERVEDIQNMV